MSKVIPVTVRDKIATAPDDALYVCGNSDFAIKFDFDGEWDAYDTKTARFTYNGTYQDKVFSGDECPVPVISDTYSFKVGVFAGNLKTTTPAHVNAKKSILCGSGSPAAPSLDVYAQIMEKLNNSGGAVSPEQIEAAVSDYFSANPIAQDFKWLGDNPIPTTGDDTPAKWSELGTGFARFTAKLMDKQPGTYGLLLNFSRSGTTMQIFHLTNSGPAYIRSGNMSNGWDSKGWRKLTEGSYSGVTGGVTPPSPDDSPATAIAEHVKSVEVKNILVDSKYPNGGCELTFYAVTADGTEYSHTAKIKYPPEVDTTLKKQGAAADSAVVGAKIDKINEDIAAVVKESESEPETQSTELWIKPSSETLKIPQINDDAESAEDTWSGKKIASAIRAAIDGLPNASGVMF